ncbi:MAG TPA: hypothetical protein ENO05_07085 [Bacteroides sp.]|nr:hypothetical protein [Bacteroides sp.]
MKKLLFLGAMLTFICGLSLSAQTHHWPLTENLNDVVGDLHGTNNGVTFENDAERGPVAYFNGDNAYANLPSFVNGLTEITVAVWFRMDESRVWARVYSFGEGDQTEPKDCMMVIPVSGNNNMYRFTLSNPGGTWYDIDFPMEIVDIQTGTWYQSTVVLKPDSIILYHNGAQIFAESGFERAFGTLNDVENALGKSFWPDPLWKGAISDLRVYDSAMTPAEVKALYDETKAASAEVPEPDHHWPLTADLIDAVGDLDGTNNGVTFENDAVRGPVAYFNGDNAYANLPSFVNGLTEISVAVWFRMDESRVWSRIYSFGEGDQTEPKDVMMVIPVSGNNNMYRFTLSNPGGTWYDIDFPMEIVDIQTGTWYQSTVVLKPDSIILYHNGAQIFAESGFERAFGTLNDVENALGKSFWPDPLWKGAISDLRVYKSALTPSQVKAVYDATGATTGISEKISDKNVPLVYTDYNRIGVKLDQPRHDEVVSVFSITGSLVAQKPVSQIGTVSFNTGIYVVRVVGSNVNYATKVFIK